MKRRQTIPRQWLVADSRLGEHLWRSVRKLPSGSGILFLYRDLPPGKRARLLAKLRRLAGARKLVVVDEAARRAARVHNSREVLRAGLTSTPVLFLSPMNETRSHPDWQAIPPMHASALVRLTKVPVIALGGMDERRFQRIQQLGFSGWAAIDAWLRT